MNHRSLRHCLAILVLAAFAGSAFGAPEKLEATLRLPNTAPGPGACFAIFLTGDGGWADLDQQVARRLTAADLPVIGWDSRAYYWTRRTPEEASADLARVIRQYRETWKRPEVVVIGFSRGADVLSFLVNRMSPEDRATLRLVTLLGPAHRIDFEFHLSDFLHEPDPKDSLAVVPEIERMRGLPLLLIHAKNDPSSCAADLPADLGRIEIVPGDHHFGRDYDKLAGLILDAAKIKPAPGTGDAPKS